MRPCSGRTPVDASTLARGCAAALALAAVIGCDGETPPEPTRPTGTTLEGRVRLADGAELPQYADPDMARAPLHTSARTEVPAACAGAASAARRPVALTAERLLAGVVVAASDFSRVRRRKPAVHRVAIRDCRLQPATVAATGGDTLALENEDAFTFEPLLGPTYRARSLERGRRVLVPLVGGQVESVRCSRAAPCGRSDVIVFRHPVHALTDARGAFRIADFPPSELVRVSAWHPLFEESETFVWLEPGEVGSVELVLSPRPGFAAAAGGHAR